MWGALLKCWKHGVGARRTFRISLMRIFCASCGGRCLENEVRVRLLQTLKVED
jgi:hypothetical protein